MALIDSYTLSVSSTFQNRVQESIVTAAIAISNEGGGVNNHAARSQFATKVLLNPSGYMVLFSASVATDATVVSQAGTPTVVSSNVTDVAINNAVSGQWNSFLGVL